MCYVLSGTVASFKKKMPVLRNNVMNSEKDEETDVYINIAY